MALSKHRSIKYQLIREIESGHFAPHSPLSSERDLALRFSTSIVTIRKVLREMGEEGLIHRFPRKGTFVSPPAKKHQFLVVSSSPFLLHIWDSTNMNFLSGIFEAMKESQKTAVALPVSSADFAQDLPDIDLVYRDLAGVLFYRDLPILQFSRKTLEQKGIPFLFYGSDAYAPKLGNCSCYLYSEEEIAALALDHLFLKKNGNFAVIYSPANPAMEKRFECFRKGLRSRGRTLEERAIFRVKNPSRFFEGLERPKELSQWVAELRGKGYGLFAATDGFGIKAMNEAFSQGFRLPEDLAVIGVDNLLAGGLLPIPLTSVDIPIQEDGRKCFHAFLRMVSTARGHLSDRSHVRLIKRSST